MDYDLDAVHRLGKTVSGKHISSIAHGAVDAGSGAASADDPHIVHRKEQGRRLEITIERTFGETRRRVKVIGRLPGEHSCLSLVWAVLDRASAGWRGFTMTPAGLRLLQDLRRALHDRQPNCHNEIRQSTPKAAYRQPIPLPPHRIMTVSERNLRQATITPLLGRHHRLTQTAQAA